LLNILGSLRARVPVRLGGKLHEPLVELVHRCCNILLPKLRFVGIDWHAAYYKGGQSRSPVCSKIAPARTRRWCQKMPEPLRTHCGAGLYPEPVVLGSRPVESAVVVTSQRVGGARERTAYAAVPAMVDPYFSMADDVAACPRCHSPSRSWWGIRQYRIQMYIYRPELSIASSKTGARWHRSFYKSGDLRGAAARAKVSIVECLLSSLTPAWWRGLHRPDGALEGPSGRRPAAIQRGERKVECPLY